MQDIDHIVKGLFSDILVCVNDEYSFTNILFDFSTIKNSSRPI